ncbi:putative Apolipoprotein B-100 [Hypsibius exemplaris]|uniref:Apolipoprotein B-100 n=1 Tax=Hypsibius exemplaris TaxID=2072580 RepID=A0A1W0XEP6_HYPEX|nr:putative Apolipoprotein B-100 [Hypsibius exemplaris]
MARLVFICLASLVVITFAGPLKQQRENGRTGQRQEEASSSENLRPLGKCDEKDNIFKAGSTYQYKYFGKAETGLGFGDSRTVGLAMECQVRLAVPQPCEYRMKVSDCEVFEQDGNEDDDEDQEGHRTLEEEVRHLELKEQVSRRGFKPSDRSQELSRMVSQHHIQAQIANGEVARVVYHDDEEIWVVNFKKAILDALQVDTSMKQTGEREGYSLKNGIQGLCPTKFSEKSTVEHIIIEKDLDSCIHAKKNNWNLSPLTPVWNMSLVSKVMDAESVCSYKLERSSHIRSMTCRETHHLLSLPYTDIQAATANVTQTLRFVRKEQNAEQMDRSLSTKTITSILYEHENATDVDRKDGQGKADDILKELVQMATDGLDIDSPAKFDDFVDELRDSENLDDVLSTVRQMRDNEQEISKYLLVQGLIQCNAPTCLRALNTLMQSDEIPRAVFEPVMMGLALTKQQDPLFLKEVKEMCEQRPTRTCALMVGALAHKLVEEDEEILEDRKSAEPIEEAAKFLMELIDDKCEPSDKLDKADEDSDATKLIIALKALGNLGHVAQKVQKLERQQLSHGIEDKIVKCMTEARTPDNVTVAAIHAFRRFVPSQKISQHLLTVLADQEESSDVRMAACMASVRMAGDKIAVRNIVKVMETEKSDQVKAFMVSHLRTVLKSEDPHYKKVAEHLKEILQEKGQSDLPKIKARIPHSLHLEFSKFYQAPFLDDEENDFGAQVETVAMFSTKSYLPCSLQFNVSTQVFGDYINVLETGVDMQGVEHLVEKVLGPHGLISKSKFLKKVQEKIARVLQVAEELGYKHLRIEDAKEFARKIFELTQSKEYKDIIDQVFSTLQEVDTSALTQMFSHIRAMDLERILETIRRSIPQSAQLTKIAEKLKRISYRDATKETLIEVLEAFGITTEKSREILQQAKQYGINIDHVVAWVKQTDFRQIQEQLQNLRFEDIQQKFQLVIKQLQKLISWATEKFNLPSLQAVIDMTKKAMERPQQMKQIVDSLLQSIRRGGESQRDREDQNNEEDYVDEEDEEDEEQNDQKRGSRNDHESLDQMPWGRQVKSFKRGPRDEDRDGKDDEEDVDMTAFLRVFGDEIGFIAFNDIAEFFDMSLFQQALELSKGRWADILDGFDIQPTVAAKLEGLHHISTGLGLPLQITLNMTGIATVHIKMQPEGSSLRQSAIEVEPSAALQITGGMTIDLPSIHSIAVVTNTTVKSEFEFKMKLNVKKDSVELDIQKPDEELDLIRIRHEVKLVKDEEDFEPFENAKSHEVKTAMCLPDAFERITGLKICSELETSAMKGKPMLSHGPHELRVYIEESEKTGLQHIKFAGRHNQQAHENRFEFNVRAPGHQLQREARAVVTHDRQHNHVQMNFDIPQQSTPRAQFFYRNLAGRDDIKFGVQTGVDVELEEENHYNASVTVIAKIKGYSSGSIKDMIKDARFNYTLGLSVQAPKMAVNVSTTTAKVENALFMEHNLTYYISDDIKSQAMKRLRFPGSEQRDDVSKFTLRHGVRVRSDYTAHDVQAFIKLLTFPLMEVAEPTIYHIAQIRFHRDFRHIGLHSNTTWLNEHDEVEFFNASATVNNLVDLVRLHQQQQRTVSLNFNISRNDWHVALENELEKTASSEWTLTNEFTSKGQYPEGHSVVDSLAKRVMADLKAVASIRKFKAQIDASHTRKHHKIRRTPRQDDDITFRHREMTVTIENKLKKKTASSTENGFWNQRTFRGDGQKAFEVKTTMQVRKNGDAKVMDVNAVTHFGNDARDRDALVSFYLVHNATATNIPFSFDHFTHFLISKQEGLKVSMNSSIDKNDETYFSIGSIFQVNPRDFVIRAGVEVGTPFLDHSARAEIKKTRDEAQVEVKLTSKAEPESRIAQHITRHLVHDLRSTTKIGLNKMAQSLRFRHAKLESDLKIDFDLFGDNSGFEEQTSDEDDYEQEENNQNEQNGAAKSSAEQQQRSQQKNKKTSVENRRRAPRAVSSRRNQQNNRDDETDDENDQDTDSRTQQNARNGYRQNYGRSKQFQLQSPQSGRRSQDGEHDEDYQTESESQNGKFKHTFLSLKKRFDSIKPTIKSSLRVRSLDRELLPSFTVQAKLSPRKSKIDVQVQEVPRSMESFLTHKQFTLQGEIEKEKAALKLIIVGRGEAGVQFQLRGEQHAEAKIYDCNLLESGETIHAQVILELPTEKQIRTKIYVNKHVAGKIAHALKQTAKKAVGAAIRFYKEKHQAALQTARHIYSDEKHPIYDLIRPFVKGSAQQWKNDMMEKVHELKNVYRRTAESLYEDSEFVGISGKDLVKKIKEATQKAIQAIREFIDQTPIGAVVEAIPTKNELARRVEHILIKHFARQLEILKRASSQISVQWDSYDAASAWEKAFEIGAELKDSIEEVQARQLGEKTKDAIKDLLLETIRMIRKQAEQSQSLKEGLEKMNIQSLEDSIRNGGEGLINYWTELIQNYEVMLNWLGAEQMKSVIKMEGDKLVVTLPHPFRWNSFKCLPQMEEGQLQKAYKFLEQSKRAFRSVFDDDNVHISLADRQEGFRFKWSEMKNLHKKNLPIQTAMIFGDRQIMTFDGKVYSIPQDGKKCTYLMARGTKKENFALVKTCDGLTLTLPEMSVTINEKNEVRLNNSRTVVQLPVESGNKKTTVKMVGDTIEVESQTGITLKFNGEKQVHVVELSSGMWDESTGLLGTNDNEADNDWKMPSGKQASHAEEFVNAFELSKEAQCQLTRPSEARQQRGGPQCKESSKCATFFRNSDSDLSTCFETVQPDEFMFACEQETRQCNQTVTEEIVCSIIEAYRTICHIKGVETESPEECETCDGRKENSKWNIRGNQRKVDVVVVVSEHQDLAKEHQSPAEKIRALMDTITRKLQQWNGQDVRIALVGFSGAGVHKDGHSHSIDNKQFDIIHKLPQALKTLQFKGRQQADVLEAIDFVVETHDFRPEASKIILVFGPEERQHVSGGQHQSVARKLVDRGITVSVFAKYDELKERDLGLNFDGTVMSGKSKAEDTRGEMPSQRMSRLAKQTRGAIFKLDSVFSQEAGKKSQAEERTANTILEQIKREETMCKTCVCQQTDLNQLISSCKVSACA